MKILIFSDPHWSTSSSIIKKQGNKYSVRLENLIKSINWVEQEAIDKNCDIVICAGDFFDRSTCSDQEITALREIKWNNLKHYTLIGNHESSVNGLAYSTSKTLETENNKVISEPEVITLGDTEIAFLPYIIESDRRPVSEYFKPKETSKRIIISHNDLKGIEYRAGLASKEGFEISDLEANCDLCINGHLHNGPETKSTKVINIKNLTGKDFGENAFKHMHEVIIINTKDLSIERIENPYAFNFYQLEINDKKDLELLDELKNNAVVSIKCNEKYLEDCKAKLNMLTNIVESRLIVLRDLVDNEEETTLDATNLRTDHIKAFYTFCKEKLENTKILEEELTEICK